MTFSKRYGYTKVSDIIIREEITPEIQNSICSCFDYIKKSLNNSKDYINLERHLWCYFLNKRMNDFENIYTYPIVATEFLENPNNQWYRKLDLIEASISFLNRRKLINIVPVMVTLLNNEFERLNFGYRVIDNLIVEITSDLEIKTIEQAIDENTDNVRMHLNKALALYSQRPTPDYRNSIKESISAVEAVNREITGESTLNLKKMESKGLSIPLVLTKSFNVLYGYTNDPSTGIRHSLMDETGEHLPKAEEALYMIITCSAFINYLKAKMKG